jgi:hypothetical protein
MIQQPRNATCHGTKRKMRRKMRHIEMTVLRRTLVSSRRL